MKQGKLLTKYKTTRERKWILLAGLFLALNLGSGYAWAQGEAVGKIIGINGAIEYLAGSGQPVAEAQPGEVRTVSFERWEIVKFHQLVYATDQFRTGKRSRLRILLNDKSLVALGPNSQMEVKSYLYNSEDKLRQGVIGMAHGLSMYLVNKSQNHKNSSFKIITPTANVAARGTQGFLNATPKVTFVANKAGVVDAGTRVTDDCDKLKKKDKEEAAKLTVRVGAAMGTKIEKCKPPTDAEPLSSGDFNRILDIIIGIPGVTTANIDGQPLIEVAGAQTEFSDDFVTELEGLGESFGDDTTFTEFNDPFSDTLDSCINVQ